MSEVVKAIRTSIGKSGFVLIVTNDYEPVDLRTLNGTHKDGQLMKETFEQLNFIIDWKRNVNKGELGKMIYEASHCKPSQEVLASYKCIAFVFSGHGGENGKVHMQDGQQVDIGQEIIGPFLPQNCKHLAKIPKLFFIDACRGRNKMEAVLVPRGSESTKGAVDTLATYIPANGNILVGYSTLDSHESFEESKTGGKWMSLLAKHISTNERDSIESVLVDVRAELSRTYKTQKDVASMQQPETINRLNVRVFLKGSGVRVLKKHAMAAVFPSAKPNGSSQSTHATSSNSQILPQACYSSAVSAPQNYQAYVQVGSNDPLQPASLQPLQPQYCATTSAGAQYYTTDQQGIIAPQPVTTIGPSPGAVHNAELPPQKSNQQLIGEYSSTHCPKLAQYKDVQLMNYEYNHVYYRSTVDVRVMQLDGNSLPVTGDSREYFLTNEMAREMAAKDAWNIIQEFEHHKLQQQQVIAIQQQERLAGPPPPSITVPMNPPQAMEYSVQPPQAMEYSVQPPQAMEYSVQPPHNEGTPGPVNSRITRAASIDGSPPKGSARAKLNDFLQSHGTKPQFDFICESSNGQQRYQCTIKYTLPGQLTKRCKSHGYYPSKADAKEQAARKILKDEGARLLRSNVQEPQNVSRSTVAVSDKVWKSKLKEYFDKKGQPSVVLDYTTWACPQGYVSVVCGPEFGEAKGDVRKSKKEAEQSAAQKALEKLL